MIETHGDLPIFSYAEFEPITSVYFREGGPHGTDWDDLGDHVGIE